jgi:hypothetical protein
MYGCALGDGLMPAGSVFYIWNKIRLCLLSEVSKVAHALETL